MRGKMKEIEATLIIKVDIDAYHGLSHFVEVEAGTKEHVQLGRRDVRICDERRVKERILSKLEEEYTINPKKAGFKLTKRYAAWRKAK